MENTDKEVVDSEVSPDPKVNYAYLRNSDGSVLATIASRTIDRVVYYGVALLSKSETHYIKVKGKGIAFGRMNKAIAEDSGYSWYSSIREKNISHEVLHLEAFGLHKSGVIPEATFDNIMQEAYLSFPYKRKKKVKKS